jgi:hypothetical protein
MLVACAIACLWIIANAGRALKLTHLDDSSCLARSIFPNDCLESLKRSRLIVEECFVEKATSIQLQFGEIAGLPHHFDHMAP